MRKAEKNQKVQDVSYTGYKVKEDMGDVIDITVIDYMAIAALEKLGLSEKQIKGKSKT